MRWTDGGPSEADVLNPIIIRLSPGASLVLLDCLEHGVLFSESEIARGHAQSRLSGMEVVFDVTASGEEWSPVVWHQNEHPIGWVHLDGRRSEGPTRPSSTYGLRQPDR